jgi:hypothetical protein
MGFMNRRCITMELPEIIAIIIVILLVSALGGLYLYLETKEMEESQQYFILREQWRERNGEKDKEEV